MSSTIDLDTLPPQFKQAVEAIRAAVPAELASPKWGIIWYVALLLVVSRIVLVFFRLR